MRSRTHRSGRPARHRAGLPAGLCGLLLLFGCGRSGPEGAEDDDPATRRPNVLLISLDTTRADFLGAYGQPDDPTPRIDGLAREGVLFEQCSSPVPITLPSHASLLTGTYPLVHGVHDNASFRLTEQNETLAEVLGRAGYATAAQVAVFLMNRESGLGQGFAAFRDTSDARAADEPGAPVPDELPADVVADGAIRLLREMPARPFFLFVHFFDAHSPYAPPPGFAERFARADRSEEESAYLGELAFIDTQVGRILDELALQGLAENTVVALTADHGESFGEHGEIGHSYFIYDATTHVPLLVRWPGNLPEGVRVPGQVRSVDVAPTLLELCQVAPLPRAQGTSLTGMVMSESPGPPRFAYLETLAPYLDFRYSPLRGLRGGGLKYILAPRPELYDLRDDPGETRNLFEARPDEAAAMRARLEEVVRRSVPLGDAAAETGLSEEERARLQSIGYMGGGAGDVDDLVDLEPRGDDPKDRIQEMLQFSTAQHRMRSGDYVEAVRLLAGLIARDEGNPVYLAPMGEALIQLGAKDGAREAFTRLVRVAPDDVVGRERLAQLAAERQDIFGALVHLEALTRLLPDRPAAWIGYGRAQAEVGDLEGAERSFRCALAIDPDCEEALLLTVRLHIVRGEPEAAIARLTSALERLPRSVRLVHQLAWLRATSTRPEIRDGAAALELCGRLAGDGRATTALIEACALAELDRFEEALAALARARANATASPDGTLVLERAAALEELFRSGRPAHTDQPL